MVDVSNVEELQTLLNDLDNTKDNKKTDKHNGFFTPLVKQTIFTLGLSMSPMAGGCVLGFTAILFPQLREHNDLNFELNNNSEALIASALPITVFLGCSITGVASHTFGKKVVMSIALMLAFIGWITSSLAYNYPVLLISRLIIGLSCGLLLPNGSVFISEMASPKYRSHFLLFIALFNMFGILFTHVLGTFLTWRLTSACCSLVPLVCLSILRFYPESPSWLISKGKYDLGIKSFYFIRGNNDKHDLKQILSNHREKIINCDEKFQLSYFKRPEIWKPLLIVIFYFATGQFSGYNIISVYAVDIMQGSLSDSIDKYLAMIILDLIRMISSLITIMLVKYLNIRTLAMLSGVLTTFALGSLSASLYLVHLSYNIPSLVILMLLILYMFFVNFGIKCLPWMLVAEVFPTKYRNILTSLCECSANIMLFTALHSAPYMFDSLGLHGTFLVYFLVTLFATLILAFFLPETKGKTLNEIENSFTSKTK